MEKKKKKNITPGDWWTEYLRNNDRSFYTAGKHMKLKHLKLAYF